LKIVYRRSVFFLGAPIANDFIAKPSYLISVKAWSMKSVTAKQFKTFLQSSALQEDLELFDIDKIFRHNQDSC
jgi:hypothetical protein